MAEREITVEEVQVHDEIRVEDRLGGMLQARQGEVEYIERGTSLGFDAEDGDEIFEIKTADGQVMWWRPRDESSHIFLLARNAMEPLPVTHTAIAAQTGSMTLPHVFLGPTKDGDWINPMETIPGEEIVAWQELWIGAAIVPEAVQAVDRKGYVRELSPSEVEQILNHYQIPIDSSYTNKEEVPS